MREPCDKVSASQFKRPYLTSTMPKSVSVEKLSEFSRWETSTVAHQKQAPVGQEVLEEQIEARVDIRFVDECHVCQKLCHVTVCDNFHLPYPTKAELSRQGTADLLLREGRKLFDSLVHHLLEFRSLHDHHQQRLLDPQLHARIGVSRNLRALLDFFAAGHYRPNGIVRIGGKLETRRLPLRLRDQPAILANLNLRGRRMIRRVPHLDLQI